MSKHLKTTPACDFCETTKGLRVAGCDHNGRPEDFICADCFTGTDTGPCFDDLPLVPVTLVTYQHVWTRKFRGEQQYDYFCTWSDGSETREMALPWGRMDGAVELPATSEKAIQDALNATIEANNTACAAMGAELVRLHADTASYGEPALQAAE